MLVRVTDEQPWTIEGDESTAHNNKRVYFQRKVEPKQRETATVNSSKLHFWVQCSTSLCVSAGFFSFPQSRLEERVYAFTSYISFGKRLHANVQLEYKTRKVTL